MKNTNKKDKLIWLCILMVLYIGVTMLIAGQDIRAFKRSNGEVVYATIKSTSIYTDSHGTGRRRHTNINKIAEVEFTYNEETQTATVHTSFTKKVGDTIKLGITEEGRIFVLHMKFDLTFLILTGIFITVIIVSCIKAVNQDEKTKNRNNAINTYAIKFDDDIYDNDEPALNRYEQDMRDMNREMLKSDIQTAAAIARNTKNNQYGNDKKVVDEVPKLKFELKQPLNHENDSMDDE